MDSEKLERKLTTILSADVVGYSRLMGRDEAGTLSALKTHRKELLEPKAAQYHGRTIKLMGDGVLMEFGSVVDAVLFATEVQCLMRQRNADIAEDRQIVFRVGINIGDIIVEGDDIYGDGVNVAARLEGLAQPGSICLSRTVFNHVKGKVDLTFEDMGEHQVKNIANPVLAYRVVLDDRAKALATPVVFQDTAKLPFTARRYALAASLVLLLAGAGLAWWQPWLTEFEPASVARMALPLPDKPSIAVLPFNNFSDDPAQDYFADGMTEDLITDLSQLSGIFVISRNSSWTFKDRSVRPQQVAEELGVRYVLEGSVQRQGDKVRINAQLIDAIGGHHIWAERYDGTMDDVFALQDNVLGQIVAALAVSLTSGEQASLGQVETEYPQAYDFVLQGMAHLLHDTEEEVLNAIALFEKAIEIDPDYGRAYAGLAAANLRIVLSFWGSSAGVGWEHAWERLNVNLAKAMKEPTPLAYAVSAQLLVQQGRYDEAFVEVNRAMALAPNDPDNHISKAKILNATGRAAEAEEAARWAMRLDPQYAPNYLRVLAVALFNQERYEEAVETLERVVSQQSDVTDDYATLVASYGHLGRNDDAPAKIEKYNAIAVAALFDTLTVQEFGWWWSGDIFGYDDSYRERLQVGLRKAGVPEGAGTDLSRDEYMRFITKSNGEFSVDGATKIDATAAKALNDREGVIFVDVRAPPEFDQGRIPGANNLSLVTGLSKSSLSKIAGNDDEIAFYCHGKHCAYSAYASAKALAWGFKRVYHFAGGFPAWVDTGYPVEVAPAQ
jgi:adenylate cyclase